MSGARLAMLLAVAAVAISLGTAMAAADPVEISYHECSGANYTDGSQYATNLAGVLADLPFAGPLGATDSNGWFGDSTAGTVSGLAMCYADCDAARCHDFLHKATAIDPAHGGGLMALCPHSRVASLLVYSGDDGCLRVLRYSDGPLFLSFADTTAAFAWQSAGGTPIPAADVASMREARWRLLSHLAESAAADSRPMWLIATGSQAYAAAGAGGGSAASQVVYGLAQCTRYLEPSECGRCLANLLAVVASRDDDMANATRGSVRGFSCYLRYQVNEPIDIGGAAAPAPQPPPPADHSGAAEPHSTGSTATMMLMIAGLAAALGVYNNVWIF